MTRLNIIKVKTSKIYCNVENVWGTSSLLIKPKCILCAGLSVWFLILFNWIYFFGISIQVQSFLIDNWGNLITITDWAIYLRTENEAIGKAIMCHSDRYWYLQMNERKQIKYNPLFIKRFPQTKIKSYCK